MQASIYMDYCMEQFPSCFGVLEGSLLVDRDRGRLSCRRCKAARAPAAAALRVLHGMIRFLRHRSVP